MKKVLFVCVENSCRSQMAEAFGRKFGRERCEVFSAGSSPSGEVNPDAKRVMTEKGIDISHQVTKSLNDLPVKEFDYVVTMGCGDACPAGVQTKKTIDWIVPDPKGMPIEVFRFSRDLIERKVRELFQEMFPLEVLK